jgi:hypothetical protein
LIETAKEEEFDYVEQIKTDYFSDNELLSVMAYNEKISSINYHTSIFIKFWKVSVKGRWKRNK